MNVMFAYLKDSLVLMDVEQGLTELFLKHECYACGEDK